MKSLNLLILTVLCLNCARSMPLSPPEKRDIFTLLQQSDWFPIEVNVPDTITNIGQGVQNFGQGISSGVMNLGNNFQNWAQNLPFINRITSYFGPKPMKYVVWVPMKRHDAPFNPFVSATHFLPMYP